MRVLIPVFIMAVVGLAIGCGPAPDDSAGNAREMSKEMPKPDPNVKDMPSPLEGYTPAAGEPPGRPKK